ncbi:MAG: hypothetical protein J6J06_05510 [Bacteroidaceae bacterium]|nr:hypothetical protein [Bacteroidaceae bacterium]
MKRTISIILSLYIALQSIVWAQETPQDTSINTDAQVTELLRNMPNVEVGKGVSFSSKDNRYKLTMRLRLQSMVGLTLDNNMNLSKTDVGIKRFHMRFDGHVFTPKVAYSIQLGYTPYDAKELPNGSAMNIIRDAMIYYIPSSAWSLGLGQTKLRGGRANINSSSALQFVDRSIVNSEFSIDRDFGLFAEFHNKIGNTFNYAIKGSITTGEGRNYGMALNSGLAYTARVELYPLGKFTSRGEVSEGSYVRESSPKLAIGGAFSYNDRASRLQGQKGSLLQDDSRRSMQAWFADLIFKYQGFAFYADAMGRLCHNANITDANGDIQQRIYTGWGVNVQASYIFTKDWEIALRHSTLLPDSETAQYEGYKTENQATLAIIKYFIGHNLKVHADFSYNYATGATAGYLDNSRWIARLSVDVGI